MLEHRFFVVAKTTQQLNKSLKLFSLRYCCSDSWTLLSNPEPLTEPDITALAPFYASLRRRRNADNFAAIVSCCILVQMPRGCRNKRRKYHKNIVRCLLVIFFKCSGDTEVVGGRLNGRRLHGFLWRHSK